MQQAAGIAQSWRTNRDKAYAAYERQQARFESKYPTKADQEANASKAPQWCEFNLPVLKQMKIEANQNVAALNTPDTLPVKLEAARGQGFDYWIRISTLEKGQPLWLPVKLAEYHKKKLAQHQPNTSVTLERRTDGTWWLTLTFDEQVKPKTPQAEPVAIDVGINNFITTSTGQHYGTFQGKLNERFERDRVKRQRKAVKDFFHDHPDSAIVLEALSVSTMRFKSRRMNAKLYASNLAHIPEHIEWVASKSGLPVVKVNPAYSSQECNRCHFVHRHNRPNQQTFCCQVCGYQANADEAAAHNLVKRLHDAELAACTDLASVKQLLHGRHQAWCAANGYP